MDKRTKEQAIKEKTEKHWTKKRIVAAICAAAVAAVFLLSCLYPALGLAAAVDDAKAARDKAKNELDAIKNNKADLVKEFTEFDNELGAVEDEVIALTSSIDKTKKDIVKKEAELAEAEANTEAYEKEFKTRARIMYENGNTSYLEVLFGAKSFGDFLERVEIVGSVVKYDRTILDRYVENQKIIKNAKTEMEQLLADQQQQQTSLEYRQDQLEILLQKQQVMIDELSKDEKLAAKAYEAAEKKYEEEERKVQEEIRRRASTSVLVTNYSGGKFQWPVPSTTRITSQFGWREHPIYKTRKLHAGLDIGCGYGSNIVAAEAGTVILARSGSGYGKYIIIDHGNGYTTLYAHNSQLLVSVGQTVVRGQLIAKSGATGNVTGPHCHFEVRYKGAVQNPLNYV